MRDRWTTQPAPYFTPPQQPGQFSPPGAFQPQPGQFQQPPSFPQVQQPVPSSPYTPPQPQFGTPPNGQQPQLQNQQVEYRWRPPQVQLYRPEPTPEPNRTSPSGEPPLLPGQAILPVGIPQFVSVNAKMASGLRPSMDDGLDWLRSANYRAVLHVHLPGEDTSADRREVEKRGMTYHALEVSPQSLSKEIAESFQRLVTDSSNQPVFVYDRDGSLAGGLWYLYSRMIDSLPDEAARLRARGLGLREDDDNHRLMWLAVQRILSELPR